MAGDWIKVEHATVDKPEVALFSELLGIPVPQGFGLLVMFWMWCDKHSRNGVVTQASRSSIDTVTHTPGFSAALESVGWAAFDDSARTLTLPNFLRHNESSAKTRALGSERAKRFRNADTVTEPLQEKRREEKSTHTSLRSVCVALATPTADHESLAKSLGVSCTTEFQKYRDWLASSGKRQRDESAGFRNWLRKAGEFKARDAPRQSQADRRATVADQIFGRGKHVANGERDITGTAERLD